MKAEAMRHEEITATEVAPLQGDPLVSLPDDAIDLRSFSELEWVMVRTGNSLYDLVVLPGGSGEVLIRGGRHFPEFRRAVVSGSSFGQSALWLGRVCVGRPLEFRADGQSFVTSRIQAAWRRWQPATPARA